MSTTRLALVSTAHSTTKARATVRAAVAALPDLAVTVLDLDGWYRPVADEGVVTLDELGLDPATVHRAAVALGPRELVLRAQASTVRTIGGSEPVLVVRAGVILLGAPSAAFDAARASGIALVARDTDTPADGLWPARSDVAAQGTLATALFAVRPDHPAVAASLMAGWQHRRGGWLDHVVAGLPHLVLDDPSVLLSAWNLRRRHRMAVEEGVLQLDGRPVAALDLSELDPAKPWCLRPNGDRPPRARLSDHPALADVVAEVAAGMAADRDTGGQPGAWDLSRTSLGLPVDDALRHLYRGPEGATAPDPFAPAAAGALRAWLTAPVAEHHATRYLLAVRGSRADLTAAFPRVPGRDTEALVAWAARYAVDEGYPAELLPAAPRRPVGAPARPPRDRRSDLRPGVAVIGYLRGELGIGESARLMVSALDAVGTPHASVPVDTGLLSRQTGDQEAPGAVASDFDTALICVNADHVSAVAAAVPAHLRGRRRIGMWYWEVEEFPKSQHGGFDHVDEVWAATDFIRDAISPHSPVPVRTVTPPLPQRGAAPAFTRADLGLPEGPLALFSFDFLSTAERKNPWGLVEAFRATFAPGQGPVLVLKSINAARRSDDAERLRLLARGRSDIILMERHLDGPQRDALTALCDVYVSLHRSEGLGLTMAEAMAWGKPVIATAYSGNLQFMTEENSFLVPWSPVAIPDDAAPYPAGGTWADPDLEAAGAAMRLVFDRPDVAAARGARAASDIATLHSPRAAGERIAALLAQGPGDVGRRREAGPGEAVQRIGDRARRTLRPQR